MQGLPVLQGTIPFFAFGCVRTSLQVFEGRFIGGNHSRSGARFDRHIADRHATFHRELANCLASVLKDVSLSTTGSNLRDHGKDDVLRCSALWQGTINGDSHGLKGSHRQCLSRQNMFDLAGTNPHCQCTECSVG